MCVASLQCLSTVGHKQNFQVYQILSIPETWYQNQTRVSELIKSYQNLSDLLYYQNLSIRDYQNLSNLIQIFINLRTIGAYQIHHT